jgi:hypothetical protein
LKNVIILEREAYEVMMEQKTGFTVQKAVKLVLQDYFPPKEVEFVKILPKDSTESILVISETLAY